ncbi:MAG: cryptochrome/photolyase family protein [Verrucomicrobiota bacterium]
MAAITLVFPHQLFPNHPALCRDREIHLIEDTLYFGDPFASPGRFHQQKILLHRASMKAAADWWSEAGYSVHYHDYYRQTTISEWLKAQAPRLEITEIHLTQCCDYLLEKRIRNTCEALSITVQFYDSPMFLTPHDWADNHFAKRKKPFMAAFYQAQRQRMEILVDSEGKPAGGKWSYDDENRKPMPKRGGLDVPNDPCSTNDAYVAEAKTYVESHFGNYFGSTALFNYAITPEQSQTWLSEFFTWRFDRFGPYEDALSEKERVLFHSMLTPMLNIGLITPEEVVSQALQFAASNDVPLNSLEGFIRQIIGWREFMFQMYQRHGVEMRTSNFWNHQTPLPDSFWNASTGVYPIDLVIERVRDHAWAHHIERLMVLGNFMLLAEFDPKSVNDWFMETFIDAATG